MNKNKFKKVRDDRKRVNLLAVFGIFLAFILLIF